MLYTRGQANSEFNLLIFLLGLLKGFAYGIAVSSLIFFCFGQSMAAHGFTSDLWLEGGVCYGAVVLLVTAKILYDSHNHSKLSVGVTVLSVLAYYVVCYLLSRLPFEISRMFESIYEERQFRIALAIYLFVFLITFPLE